MNTTNYINTFIQVAEDCPVNMGETPPQKAGVKTISNLHFDMLYQHPYQYNSDEVIFSVFATKNKIDAADFENEKKQFFSKGQACLRCSPLAKRYGWGIHHNAEGKVAIYAKDSTEYRDFASNKKLKQVKAMRSKKRKG